MYATTLARVTALGVYPRNGKAGWALHSTTAPHIVPASIRCEHGERRCDDEVVMAASRLQSEPASRARLEDELSKLSAQQIAAGRMLGDGQLSAPHGGAEPLDQPRLADDQAVSLRRAGEWAIAADQADADMRRCLRQQFRSGVAEAALIEEGDPALREVKAPGAGPEKDLRWRCLAVCLSRRQGRAE